MDPVLNGLLVVTGAVQLGALATHIAGRKRAALAMAGANAALALVFALVIFGGALAHRENIDTPNAVIMTLAVAAAAGAAIGLIKRKESGWLFWPVWVWNFAMIYVLVRLRFFFQLTF